uniref:DDE Tnp4 domain-containing protein n=1 Tax=Cacopsylla melanoneura TaxID=428564 RepID=A0A8D8XB18_9HEMI
MRPPSPVPGPSSVFESSPAVLNSELYFLRKELDELKAKKKLGEKQIFSFDMICHSDEKVSQYTGLPSKHHFNILLQLILKYKIKYYAEWNVERISPEDQLLCTLVKLRLNLPLFVLSGMFGVVDSTISNIFLTYLSVIHKLLFKGMLKEIPCRELNRAAAPACFATFPNTRIVLDCTEIEVAIPSNLRTQREVYSSYKHRHTFKVLIGISTNAVITYVSDLYPGSTSDKVITKECGVLSHMTAGDLILCDKGFLISDLCAPLGVNVNIPPFLTNPQFTKNEVLATKQIARARIHVERAIGRLKNFRILDFIAPNFREHATKIVQVCACLVNLQYTLLKDNETFMSEV